MSGANIFSDSFSAFGVQCDVVLPDMEAEQAKALMQLIKNVVSRVELSVSNKEMIAEILQVNQTKKNEWIKPSGEFWDLLTICFDFYQMSNGALDITFTPLFDAWKSGNDLNETEIAKIRHKCGFDKVELDEERKRFRFLEEAMKLDFALFQKAYVLDILKQELVRNEVENCIVSFEEDEVLALGQHPGGDEWPLGVRNIENPDEFIHVFLVKDMFVVTAGTYCLNWEKGASECRLVLSPETGKPVNQKKTVSVKAESALLAAFVANSWLILPDNDKEIIADQLHNVEIFEAEYLSNDLATKHTIIAENENNEE